MDTRSRLVGATINYNFTNHLLKPSLKADGDWNGCSIHKEDTLRALVGSIVSPGHDTKMSCTNAEWTSKAVWRCISYKLEQA